MCRCLALSPQLLCSIIWFLGEIIVYHSKDKDVDTGFQEGLVIISFIWLGEWVGLHACSAEGSSNPQELPSRHRPNLSRLLIDNTDRTQSGVAYG